MVCLLNLSILIPLTLHRSNGRIVHRIIIHNFWPTGTITTRGNLLFISTTIGIFIIPVIMRRGLRMLLIIGKLLFFLDILIVHGAGNLIRNVCLLRNDCGRLNWADLLFLLRLIAAVSFGGRTASELSSSSAASPAYSKFMP